MKTAIMYAFAVVGCTAIVAGTHAWVTGMVSTYEVLMAVAMLLPVAAYHILMKA